MLPKGKKRVFIATIIMLVSIIALFAMEKDMEHFLERDYVYLGPSGVFHGQNGQMLVIDGGKKELLVVNEAGEIETIVYGEKDREGFFYGALLANDSEGNLYVADTLYAGKGTILAGERVMQFSQGGKYLKTLYALHYDESKAPLQYGRIQSMDIIDDAIYLTLLLEEYIEVVLLTSDGEQEILGKYPLDSPVTVSHVTLNTDTLMPIYVNRLGEIRTFMSDKSQIQLYADEASAPWRLAYDQGMIYFTDLWDRSIKKLDGSELEVVYSGPRPFYHLDVSEGRVYTADYGLDGGYVYDIMDGHVKQMTGARHHAYSSVVLDIVLMAVSTLSLVYLMGMLYIRFKALFRTPAFRKAMMIVLVSLLTTTVAIYLALTSMFRYINDNVMKNLVLYCDIMVQATDIEALEAIDGVLDYQGPAYYKIKNKLDQLVKASYESGLYYYYIVYKYDQETINGVLDYEDTMLTKHPFYNRTEAYAYEDAIVLKQSAEFVNDVSAYGTWSFAIKPILDSENQVLGIMEIGMNTDDIIKQQHNLIQEIFITVICSVVIMIVVMLEMVFYQQYKKRRGSARSDDFGFLFPLRTMIFLIFLADSMQDAFIPILASKRYTDIWGIPKEIGIALPITGQLFTAALFAFLGGFLISKIGVKKTLLQGFIVAVIGYLVCGLTTGYIGILVGKLITGIGMGLIIVSVNTLAAASKDSSATLFGEINSGILAGVTAGVGIGSVMLSRVSYKEVYMAASLIAAIGIILAIRGAEYKPQKAEKESSEIGLSQFILDYRILGFLLLVLTPFLIALSYREYFFPLYAESMGMTESGIGYLYLISGLIVIYLGPVLTTWLVQRIGQLKTLVLSSGLMALASLCFAILNSLPAAVVGIFVLSIAISFGYAAQSTYYASEPSIESFGEGKAMGVYALFDNGGQTLGPILYGFAVAFGYQPGTLVVGVGLMVLTLVFYILNRKRGRNSVSV